MADINSAMNVGYGYRRQKFTLIDAGARRVYLDSDPSRDELSELINPDNHGLRDGDTLIVVDLTDLGRRHKRLVARLAKRGVTVEVRGEAGKRIRQGKAGRPRGKFDPTPEQWADIKAMRRTDKFTLPHRMAEIQIIMGKPIASHLVRDRLKVEND